MSFDLMVFDPVAAPAERQAFISWYDEQTRWAEGHRYDDPAVTTPALRAWFLDMIREYPAMNGPCATEDVDGPRVTDYSIGKKVIYAGFAWSETETARQTMFALAKQHRVGFFDVSADNGGVWAPSPDGEYELQHGGEE